MKEIVASRKNQGSLVAILTVVLVVAIAGALAFVYWQSTNNTPETTSSTTSKSAGPSIATSSADWTLYQPKGNEYSIRLPDGWHVTANGTSLSVGEKASDIAYKTGTRATVATPTGLGGSDSPTQFSLNYQTGTLNKNDYSFLNGYAKATQLASLTTTQGNKVQKYMYVYDGAGYNNPKGAKSYNYVLNVSGKFIIVTYVAYPNTTDINNIVDQAVETLSFS